MARRKRAPRRIPRGEYLQAAINIDEAFAECKRRGIPASPDVIREALRRQMRAKEATRARVL